MLDDLLNVEIRRRVLSEKKFHSFGVQLKFRKNRLLARGERRKIYWARSEEEMKEGRLGKDLQFFDAIDYAPVDFFFEFLLRFFCFPAEWPKVGFEAISY